jgi:nitrous oxidase accessory protein
MRVLPWLCLAVTACAEPPPAAPTALAVPMQAVGIRVAAGDDLLAAVAAAPAGATLLLAPGEHQGPLVVDKPLQVWGPPSAVVRGRDGSTVRVLANGAAVRGFTVLGSGQRFDLMDGGVLVRGEDVVVEGLTVRESLFGILAERSRRVLLRGNLVVGTGLPAMGLRGDGIRLWETHDSEVVDNVVVDSRDVVVWYSGKNRLRRNQVLRSRYGTHFMYSHDNVVEDSRFVDDEVGIFVMYSRDIVLRRNLLARAGGAAGIGLGLKEAGNLTAEDNWLLANTTGIYVDASPLHPEEHNRYAGNTVRFSEVAVALHSTIARSEFVDNHFADNGAVVKVGGHGDALQCTFTDNHYDDYRGYDFDGDGRGDVPYEFRRLSTQLEGRYPELALLHGAPAMGMVDLVGELMPLFAPKRLLQDPRPRLHAPPMRWSPEN